MTLRDLKSFLDNDALEIPVDGKTYRFESPDGETGLVLAGLAQLAEKAARGEQLTAQEFAKIKIGDDQEQDFMRMVLGGTLDELVADGVSWVKIQRVTRYAYAHFALGPEAADRLLQSGALAGEAPAPANRATRRAASRAGAATTSEAASTAGTTSRRKPAPKRKGAG